MADAKEKKSFSAAVAYYERLGHFQRKEADLHRISSKIAGIDWLLGGGLPRGRATELYGDPGAGKTTIAAEFAKSFQAKGLCVIYLDFEHAVDLRWFETIGVELEDKQLWLFDQPFSGEAGVQMVYDLITSKGNNVGLVIFDSVANMVPEAELHGDMGDHHVSGQARLVARSLRKLIGVAESNNTALLFLNQTRSKIQSYGPPGQVEPTGGRALKFYTSVRFEVKRAFKKHANEKIGSLHTAYLRKQKTCPLQNATAEFYIGSKGIDREESFLSSLVSVGLIEEKAGEKYAYDDTVLAVGRSKMKKLLATDKDLRKTLTNALHTIWAKAQLITEDGE